jgi:ribosomal protein S18 acetylase RimI-like enzyme
MELNREVAHYIVRFHDHLMTDVELRAQYHLIAAMKATRGRSDQAAQTEARRHRAFSPHLSNEPDVLALAADGFEAFELRTAKRIFEEFPAGVVFNCCSKCGELANTPTARQCRFCGYDWHDAKKVLYRPVRLSDIPDMAKTRAADWGDEEYWRDRILQYLTHKLHPKEALRPRLSFVAVEGDRVVGLIAGHLTTRFGCDGELEWISVREEYRGQGVASQLLCHLAEWFTARGVQRVCVDVEPSNHSARRFYERYGAKDLKPHWMVWEDIRATVTSRPAMK